MARALFILTAIIQFSFAFHALKTGRDQKWIWIIILAPVVGCLAYYFMEVFPHSREERQLRKRIHDIAKALNPDGELKRRTEDVTNTARGVRITESSDDPYTVKIIHTHAGAVSDFVKDGMGGMAKRHEIPGAVVQKTVKFLGKGNGVTTCPVTGEPVDKSMKATINGRTIYFCCASCIAVVTKNPNLYLTPKAL